MKHPLRTIIFIAGTVVLIGLGGFFVYQRLTSDSVSGISTTTTKESKGFFAKVTEKTQEVGSAGCQEEYEKLLAVDQFDFASCQQTSVRDVGFAPDNAEVKKNNIVLVFDSSGSMAGQIHGESKMNLAKEAVWNYIDRIGTDENTWLSIVAYGHKGGNAQSQKTASCAGIEEIYTMGSINAKIAKDKIAELRPTGWTPIASSIRESKKIFDRKNADENFVLVVSDGKETCDGDPVVEVNALRAAGYNVKVSVIGFDVTDEEGRQLEAIAQAGGGDYFTAKDRQDLEIAFQQHQQKLNEASAVASQIVYGVHDAGYVHANYAYCHANLHREQAAMMLDIHVNKAVSESCADYATQTYKKREVSIRQAIDAIYEKDVEQLRHKLIIE